MSRLLRGGKIGLAFVHGVVELIMYLPLAMMIAAFFLRDGTSWLWFLPALAGYPAGYALNALLRFRHPAPVAIISLLLGSSCGFLLFGVTKEAAACAVSAWAALHRGGMMAINHWGRRFMPRHYLIGLGIYFVVSGIFGRMEPLRTLRLPLILFGIAALLLALFALNRGLINDEALSADEKPKLEPTVRRHNRQLVVLLSVIAVLIVLTYRLQAIFGTIWEQVRGWLSRLFASSPSKAPQPAQNAPMPQKPSLPPDNGKHLPHWVDWIMYGITAAVLLIAAWLLLRKLSDLPEWLRRLRAKLADMLGRDRKRADRGYTDEVESLRKPALIDRFWRKIGGEGRIRWKDLHDNESRLRYLYRIGLGRSVKSGYAFKPYLTPEELSADTRAAGKGGHLPDRLVEQYNGVRYGGKKITDEQLRPFLGELNNNRR